MRRFSLWVKISMGAIFIVLVGMVAAPFIKSAYFVPVLMYHSIDGNDKVTKLSVSPKSFERQMAFLRQNHYNVVTLETVARYIARGEPMPHRTVAITFDDGFYNNYQNAFPVLKKYSIPATVFVITGKIGSPGYLGWKEIEEMSASGLVDIASHTVTHSWLTSFDAKDLSAELKESRLALETRLGRRVKALCYPMGGFNSDVEKAARGAGYLCAVGTNPHGPGSEKDIYAIKRIKISRTSDNLFVFWFESSGFYTWVKEL